MEIVREFNINYIDGSGRECEVVAELRVGFRREGYPYGDRWEIVSCEVESVFGLAPKDAPEGIMVGIMGEVIRVVDGYDWSSDITNYLATEG